MCLGQLQEVAAQNWPGDMIDVTYARRPQVAMISCSSADRESYRIPCPIPDTDMAKASLYHDG